MIKNNNDSFGSLGIPARLITELGSNDSSGKEESKDEKNNITIRTNTRMSRDIHEVC